MRLFGRRESRPRSRDARYFLHAADCKRREDISLRVPTVGSPEKRNAAQSLSLIAAVLQVRSIAQINWSGLAFLRRWGDRQADRRGLSLRDVFSNPDGLTPRPAARDVFPPPTWSLSGPGRRGSWPRSLGPSMRRRQSANASESAEGHAAADSPPPIEISSEPNRLMS